MDGLFDGIDDDKIKNDGIGSLVPGRFAQEIVFRGSEREGEASFGKAREAFRIYESIRKGETTEKEQVEMLRAKITNLFGM